MWQLLVGIPWLISLLFALPASAIHAEEAGVVDWHKSLIGDTLTDDPSLAPVFHRVGEANESTKSYILTATASNVLAALHPDNGSVAWRYLFEESDPVITFKKHKDSVATLSGTGGNTFRLFDVHTGDLVLERHLSEHSAERMINPVSTGVTIAFDSSRHPNVYALTGGHTVRRLVTSTGGKVQWTWTAADQGSLVIYSSVVPTPSAVYVVGLAKSFASYTLHVTALSPEDGAVLAEADVKSSIIGTGPASFLVLNRKGKDEEIKDEDDATRVVWLEGGVIRSIALTPELKDKPVPVKGAVYEKIIDAGLCEHGMFVALKEDGSGRVIKLNQEEKGLKVIWEFADSAKAAHYTDSIYTGGLDKDGYPYVARVFWSHAYKAASAHILAPHLADGKGLVTGFTFPFETAAHGIIAHVSPCGTSHQ
ncbi:hypothetical protein NM688_g3770 [Phlebia brevispora]|uniref:Uncharacterized protein n=1 Tax=Phlebia brevispora TaxID=194682 RepID=A0ACC1T4S9_9APHY|nr:hypothetical protein NM688_g3770 [Phlebia brevispora]